MLARKEHEQHHESVSKKWEVEFTNLLSSVYKHQLEKKGRVFEVYTQLYDKELLVVVSLLDAGDHTNHGTGAAVAAFFSIDLKEKAAHLKILPIITDLAGMFWDKYFSVKDWDDFVVSWTEFEFKGHNFYYKITRENVKLTLMADKLLR